MNTIIKDSIRQFFIFFLALAAVLLIVTVVHASNPYSGPTASFPNGNISWPTNCGSTAGQALMTTSSGTLTCGTIQAVYQ